MHINKLSPFYKTHKDHHNNPTPESGVPYTWIFLLYFSITSFLILLKLDYTINFWYGIFISLCAYEWIHFLCHCNYKPKTALGWIIRINHLKHHNFDSTKFYELMYVKRK